ncbi:MAG: hypothetical protein EBU90_12955 [Proteobacteria bacterium]|nr:hypothetical protein [Pseudomonadota bacterium]
MLYEILSRIFLYTFLIIGICYSTRIENPIKLVCASCPKIKDFFQKIGFISDWAIFTDLNDTTLEIEVAAYLKSGKTFRWLISDNKTIGNIKIYNKTVKKNTLSFFMSYQYFHKVIESKLLDYAYNTLKDPMIALKIYMIPMNIDKNRNYILKKQKRPIPSQPPKILYEAKWEY